MANEKSHKRIEFRSEAVQEILGSVPSWIIRWGTTLFLLVVTLLLVGSWVFKYPEVVPNLDVELVTTQPPAYVVARSTGKIVDFFLTDKQEVSKGDSIAVIENPANHADMFYLRQELRKFRPVLDGKELNAISEVDFSTNLQLGDVQDEYAEFLKDFLDLRNFVQLEYYSRKIETIEKQISDYNLYYNYMYTQKQTLEEDYSLESRDFERYQALYDSSAISRSELDNSKSELLQKQHAYEGARTNLANTQIKIDELKGEVLDLELQYEQEKNDLQLAINKSFNNLNGAITKWVQDYVIIAPIDGSATFNKFWANNQNITAGEKIISIVPVDSSNIIGKLTMPVYRSGKVKVGQKVNIRFDNYPYMEFGMVTGYVDKISIVPADNSYTVDISFPDGLRTNYQMVLPFTQRMTGKAEIITQDTRLLTRIIRPLRSLIQNRSMRSMEPVN
ncbi:MAG TPA: HlyD family efflux transporter periplasmic adaptor subunit [Bacteroidales bacterium]|nr:HlyD family efflux transporter periplasmic adaptor subunit [Bacteroidales bacterium]